MSRDVLDRLTLTPEEAGVKLDKEFPPLPPLANPIVLTPLSEEELAQDEEREDPLTPVTEFGLQDLKAYWETGMRSTLPESLIRKSVGGLLGRAVESLPEGFGLAVFDGYRPLALQRRLYAQTYGGDAVPEIGYVSVPTENLLSPPAHATGAAIDLTLSWHGRALALGTSFDTFTPRSHFHALEEEPGLSRELRRMLFATLAPLGFTPYFMEWWHWEIGTGRWSALTGHRPRFGQPLS